MLPGVGERPQKIELWHASSNNFIFSKITANFLQLGKKHLFTALIRKIMKNRVEKTKLEQLQKIRRLPINFKRTVHNWPAATASFVLIY